MGMGYEDEYLIELDGKELIIKSLPMRHMETMQEARTNLLVLFSSWNIMKE
jgi:hypothetical protein